MKTPHLKSIVRAGVPVARGNPSVRVHEHRFGATGFSTKRGELPVTQLIIPGTDTAYARTVRVHELMHARHTAAKRPRWHKAVSEGTYQAIEDVRLQAVKWPASASRGMNRDALATAARDALDVRRSVRANGGAFSEADHFNTALLMLVRALAIESTCTGKAKRVAHELAPDLIGPRTRDELKCIVTLVRVGKARDGAKRFEALLRTDDGEREPGTVSGKGSRGAASASPMEIVELPHTARCQSERVRRMASTGTRLIPSRLAAVVAGRCRKPFRRVRPIAPMGTYVLDASGSMGVSPQRLAQICNAIPGALVAYYDGNDIDANGVYGALHVYARDGQRHDSDQLPNRGGGNSVDEAAIQWLMKQSAPRFLVTDGQFCGGPNGQNKRAHLLLERHRGEITVIPSYHALAAQLGIVDASTDE